jgi:hypothetical protein
MTTATAASPGFARGSAAARESGAATAAVPERLDDLLALDADTLAGLYRGASVPAIPDLSGDLRGRMLALAEMPAALTRFGALLGRQSWFPWRGKSFHADTSGSGGVNRVVVDRLRLFRFDTFVGPSRFGDFDAVQLDYDKPGNPGVIRMIKDEVRQLRPGLFLGQAWLQRAGKEPRLVLYFGLERR